jgi:hypothetical protein
VKTLVNKKMSAGNHQALINSSELSSGIYFYTLLAGNFRDTKKMILLK